MIIDPFLLKVLDVDSRHITEADEQRLELTDLPSWTLGAGEGWLIYIGEIKDNWEVMSPTFRTILRAARGLNCEYVRFHPDGRTYQEWPTFSRQEE